MHGKKLGAARFCADQLPIPLFALPIAVFPSLT